MSEIEAQWLAHHPDRHISIYGLCDLDQIHEAHVFDGWSCPGQYVECRNCDDRKCMGCVFREWGHECADNCPMCCANSQRPASLVGGEQQ